MTTKPFSNEDAMAYIFPMALLATIAVALVWLLLMQVANTAIVEFYTAADGTTSTQTSTVIANTLSLAGFCPVVLIIGFFVYSTRSAANLRNAGWAGSVTPYLNGAIALVSFSFVAIIIAIVFGAVLDPLELEILDPNNQITEISDNWKAVQAQTAFGINTVMLVPYVIEFVGAFLFFQSLLSVSSGGAQYASTRGGYF